MSGNRFVTATIDDIRVLREGIHEEGTKEIQYGV